MNMLKKYHRCFLTLIKTARFVVPLIFFEKWKVSAGLQIHPKKIKRRTNKALKAHEKGAQGVSVRRASKASKARKTRLFVNEVRREGT